MWEKWQSILLIIMMMVIFIISSRKQLLQLLINADLKKKIPAVLGVMHY